MQFSRNFIDRPIFAGVLSLFVFIAGAIAMWQLPISEYPEVVPPSVVVRAFYPGANPKVISETVAAPLEEAVNGVENMLYLSSQAGTDGSLIITVTFKLGTDPDKAQQLVQNRVSQALPRVPDIVRALGVTTAKSSPSITMVVHLSSPDNRYDILYLRNYITLNIRDKLARISGVGEAQVFGGGDYAMRLWVDPAKLAARKLTAGDVVNAVRAQNIQVAAGTVGGQPAQGDVQFELPVNAQGRLSTPEEFEQIVVRADKGAVIRVKDVARVELGASDYNLRSLLNNKPATAVAVFQMPGSNALQISRDVRAQMEELKKNFPEGMEYSIVYDPTTFVSDSIDAVIHTLLEAVALVVLVVIVFLQTWRASIIPLLAVPVSIVGTFALMYLFGFSINALTLFGLVLAIGIVVDDAIVVVENVERNIAEGLSPREAAYKAMGEVSEPIIAIALVLCAVFIPIAFISGLTGQFYRQFALTIAISTVISAFNSLTLSPALAAMLLKPHDHPKDRLTVWIEKFFGAVFAATGALLLVLRVVLAGVIIQWLIALTLGPGAVLGVVAMIFKVLFWLSLAFAVLLIGRNLLRGPQPGEPQGFDRFNRFFHRSSEKYSSSVQRNMGRKGALLAVYAVLLLVTWGFFKLVPTGYVPQQDKQYLIAAAQLPGGSSLDNTEAVIRRMSDMALKHPGVESSVAFPGLSIAGFSAASNAGIVFVTLKPFADRTAPDMSADAIVGNLQGQFMSIQDARVFILSPPPVMGLGTAGGFTLQVQDRGDLGYDKLSEVVNTAIGKAYGTPGLGMIYTGYQINVPQLNVDVDRVRALQLGVPLNEIFDAMQIYLGSYYVNDFNKFGRTFRVVVQADAAHRAHKEDIAQIKVRSMSGEMVPLGALTKVTETYGPDRTMRYNAYRSADINASAAPGYTSDQAQALMVKILDETLPKGMSFEWTDLAYQQILAGDTTKYIFPLCVLFVFLVLAAQYESLGLPMAVILIVPMCLLCAIFGVWIAGKENNIFTQIGFIVLVGLACKNAILIVEFARELERHGRTAVQAAIEASRLRLRPILMTSFAFVMGVVPLVISTGAGAEMRRDMGVAVFSGMLGVTFFGLVLTPLFYVIIRGLSRNKELPHA